MAFYNLGLLYDPHLLCDSTCCLDSSPGSTSKDPSSSSLPSSSNLPSNVMESNERDTLKHRLPAPLNKNNFPIPILPQGKNITAFQKPDWYAEYIETLLTKHRNNGLPAFSANTPKERRNNGLPDFSHNIVANLVNKQIAIKDSGWIPLLFPNFDGTKLTHFDNPLWDQTNKKFKFTLHDLSENTVQNFLNSVIGHLGVMYGICSDSRTPPYHRLFDARTRNCPIPRGSASRKPDVCLVSKAIQESGHKIQWPLVEALVEVTSSPPQRRSQLDTVLEKSALIFESQPWRRFTVSLAFHGPANKVGWFLTLCDRAGVVNAGPFELVGIGGMTLVRVLYFLAFGAPETIGVDPTIDYDPITGKVIAIHVEHTSEESQTPVRRSFQPICLLHNATQLAGRATRAWLVKEDSQFYVLKDSWVLCSHPCSEIETLRKINDTMKSSQGQEYLKHCYPILVAGQDLGDSTDIRRPVTSLDSAPPRIHRRIVTGPVGDPLTSFRSKREFCSCIRDVVKYLRFLNVKCNIIHGDISLNNLRINRVWPESTPSEDPVGYGLTIDNDYSFEKHQTTHTTSGTLPYMSIASLSKSRNFVHSEVDDLESILYTVLSICTYTIGPGILRCPIPQEQSILMNRWFHESSPDTLAIWKDTTLTYFSKHVESCLPKYWKDFTPYLKRFINACWESPKCLLEQPNIATHDKFIKILDDAICYYEANDGQAIPYGRILAPAKSRSAKRPHHEGELEEQRGHKLARTGD